MFSKVLSEIGNEAPRRFTAGFIVWIGSRNDRYMHLLRLEPGHPVRIRHHVIRSAQDSRSPGYAIYRQDDEWQHYCCQRQRTPAIDSVQNCLAHRDIYIECCRFSRVTDGL